MSKICKFFILKQNTIQFPLKLLLQRSQVDSSNSSPIHSTDIPSSTGNSFTATLSSFDYNIATSEMHDVVSNISHSILRNNNHIKNHLHQTVRFQSNNKEKNSRKDIAMATLAESEESIISESSHDKYAYKDGYSNAVRCGDIIF